MLIRRFSSASVAKNIRTSPAAKLLIASNKLDATSIPATGKHGLITKGDVLSFLKNPHIVPKPQLAIPQPQKTAVFSALPECNVDESYTDTPTSTMRSVIAKRLLHSKQNSPHLYLSIKSDITKASALRKKLKSQNIKVSMNDLVLKAAAQSLTELNAHSDISVAVATPNGLITPIVTSVKQKGLSEVNEKVKELAGRARENKLKLEEFQGGDFTVSNLGMFGIDNFSAVVNDPQPGILAVGVGIKKVRAKEESKGKGKLKKEDLEVYEEMDVRLTVDRKRVDEHKAASFLQTFSKNISDPNMLLL
eukprot:snap_masked-scaffold_4-processed-gene-3.18-mRNA-1 protein AED:0.36 eAED:0.37 QI:0/-1/0/1/-1/1/1/0/305